ncbi:MAG: 50S ribosomal protein L4 [Pirellulales bacterium]
MSSLTVYNRSGEEVGTYEIDPADIAPRINKQLLHDAVVMYQANVRQGSHRTKSRAEVAGTTKKMYRQKGTGNARAGSVRSGVRRGGGHIFAIRPRDYSFRLNRKALQLATRMAIASKIKTNQVIVLDELAMNEVKTKSIADTLKALGVYGRNTLIATENHDSVVNMSARNIEKVSVSPISDLNAYSIIQPYRVVITKAALDAIKEKASASASVAETA